MASNCILIEPTQTMWTQVVENPKVARSTTKIKQFDNCWPNKCIKTVFSVQMTGKIRKLRSSTALKMDIEQ